MAPLLREALYSVFMNRFSALRWPAALIFLTFCTWWGLRGAFAYDRGTERAFGSSIRIDHDTNLIADEFLSVPSWPGTLKWWHGPWYADTPYFRPLTMTLFWVEGRIFGPQGRVAFQWAQRLAHLVFLGVLWGFFREVAGPQRATLAVGLFASGWLALMRLPTGVDAFNCWKDQCDLWQGISFVVATWWLALFLRRSKPLFWWAALGAWCVGISIKETAYLLPFFLVVLLVFDGKLRSHWRWVAPFWILAPIFWLYRLWALGGWGNRTGEGGARLKRFLIEAVGAPPPIADGDWLPLVIVAAVLGLGVAFYRRELRLKGALDEQKGRTLRRWSGFWAVMGVAGWVQAVRWLGNGAWDSALRFLNARVWWEAVYLAAILFFYWLWLRHPRPIYFLAMGWVWVMFLPLAIQPPTSPHVHYILAPGWALWMACLGCDALPQSRAASAN